MVFVISRAFVSSSCVRIRADGVSTPAATVADVATAGLPYCSSSFPPYCVFVFVCSGCVCERARCWGLRFLSHLLRHHPRFPTHSPDVWSHVSACISFVPPHSLRSFRFCLILHRLFLLHTSFCPRISLCSPFLSFLMSVCFSHRFCVDCMQG